MTRNNTSQQMGRGATKRRQAREHREHQEALRWWAQPGVLVFAAAIALAIVGWILVIQASRRIPVAEATIDGLHLRLEEARWILDQMDHGENFQKPSAMMPDMPEWGRQRVTVELAFQNRAEESRIYDGAEFFLVPEIGDEVAPIGAQVGRARLGPGQTFNTSVHFDFDTSTPHGKLRVEWRRAGESVYFPVPEPAEHYHLRPRGGEVAFPPLASMVLPLGKVDRGRQLYDGVYGCVACHGNPQIADSNNVGPHLAGVATRAIGRVEGQEAIQYLYQSILEPNAFIAPECKGGIPCSAPSAMPEYASLMNLQDLADVLSYLASLDEEASDP